jgi:hypothetical protein
MSSTKMIVDIGKLYEKVSKGLVDGIINGREAFRIILTSYSKYSEFRYPKKIGIISYSQEKEQLIRELHLPYRISGDSVTIYSDKLTESSHRPEAIEHDEMALIEQQILFGYPECCAREYANHYKEIKNFGEEYHPFFEEIEKRLEKNRKKITTLSELLNLILNGEIYPIDFLYRDDLIPHSIECERAKHACKERAMIIREADKKIKHFISLEQEVTDNVALHDLITVLKRIEPYKN